MKKLKWSSQVLLVVCSMSLIGLSCGGGTSSSSSENVTVPVVTPVIERATVVEALGQIDAPQGTITEERVSELVQLLVEGAPSLNIFTAPSRSRRTAFFDENSRGINICTMMEMFGVLDYLEVFLSEGCSLSCSTSGTDQYTLTFENCSTMGEDLDGSLIIEVETLDYYTVTIDIVMGDCSIEGDGAIYLPSLIVPDYGVLYYSYTMTCGENSFEYEGGIKVDFDTSSVQEFCATEDGDILTYEVDLTQAQVTIIGSNGENGCFVTVGYNSQTCLWTVVTDTCGLTQQTGNYCQ